MKENGKRHSDDCDCVNLMVDEVHDRIMDLLRGFHDRMRKAGLSDWEAIEVSVSATMGAFLSSTLGMRKVAGSAPATLGSVTENVSELRATCEVATSVMSDFLKHRDPKSEYNVNIVRREKP